MSKTTATFSASQPTAKQDEAMVNKEKILARFAKFQSNRLRQQATGSDQRSSWQKQLDQNHGFYFQEADNAIATSSIMDKEVIKIWHPVLSLPKKKDMLTYEYSMLYQPYIVKQVCKAIEKADDKVQPAASPKVKGKHMNANDLKYKKFDDIIVDDLVCLGVQLVGRVVTVKNSSNAPGGPEGNHYTFVIEDASGKIVAQYWSNTGYDDQYNPHVEEMCDIQDLHFIINQESHEDHDMKIDHNNNVQQKEKSLQYQEKSLEAQANDTDMSINKNEDKMKTKNMKNIKNVKNVSEVTINYGDIIKIFGRVAVATDNHGEITFVLVYKFHKVTSFVMAHHYVKSYKVMLERLGGREIQNILLRVIKNKHELSIANEKIQWLQRKIQNHQSSNNATEEAKFQQTKSEVNRLMQRKIELLTFIQRYTMDANNKVIHEANHNGPRNQHDTEQEDILTKIKHWVGESTCLDALK